MAASISTTEYDVFVLLRAFLLTLVPCEMVRGQVNRVPMPLGEFVMLTPAKGGALGASIQIYDHSPAQTVAVSQPTEYRVGVDCFGPNSANTARIISIAFRSSVACDALPGIAPLYADDAIQLPLIDGEEQYEDRWRFELALQYTPVVTLPQQSMITIDLGVISVDATYPP